ncbi:MAG: stalk domain-containing protein, partial [Dehalobacterium sp.]
ANQISLTIGKGEAFLDNQQVVLDAAPVIENGRTLVPLRFIGEAFGAVVDWEAKSKQITVRQGQANTKLWVGSTNAEINGQVQTLDTAPKVVNGRTLVPLRFVSEALGYQVDYQAQNKAITIKKPNTPPQAFFKVDKQFIVMGEEVSYEDLSVDPDGDQIVDRIWRNNNKSFQEPGVFVVSLRVKDSRGAWSDWYEETIEVSAEPNSKPVAQFFPDSYRVFVDQPITYTDESYDPDEDEIVDWLWENRKDSFSTPGTYYVSLQVKDRRGAWSDKFVQVIEVLEKPNEPPVAQFSVDSITVDQGETVAFTDESYDPDGDELTEYQWTGKQRAYFKEGTVPVTLKVKDNRGKWSEPFTIEITVTGKVIMTEMEYNLYNPLPGETVNLTDINPLAFPELKPASFTSDNTTLLLSNSPEIVKENGILYRDTASGSVRLMYHHINGTNTNKRVYVLAENMETKPVIITMTKRGSGGPSDDVLSTGRNGLARYLTSNINERYDLAPGQMVLLDTGTNGKHILPNNCVFSMMDLNVSGNVRFTFVLVDAGTDAMTAVQDLPVLDRDRHPRGTFNGANKTVSFKVEGDQPQRFTLADNKNDVHMGGIDALTGDQVANGGNYGVVYRMQIQAGTRMGLLTNPRGGIFRGAALTPEGTVYGMPETGLISSGAQAVMNLTLDKYDQTEFIFVPPAASNLPVAFLFVPY